MAEYKRKTERLRIVRFYLLAEGRPPNAPIKLDFKIKAPYFVHPLVHHQFFTKY